MTEVVETDVLIVGSGPAGSTAAMMLSTYGVPNIMVTKYGRLADTPRAHITNQRAMEVLRDAGIEDVVVAQATPQNLMGQTPFCTSLAGEELGRLHTWYTHPSRQADHDLASPTSMCDMPQHLLEPVLANAAISRGTSLRYHTEYLSLAQDEDGVTATVRDRLRGDTYQIRAQYLIGADGGRSKVAEDIGLPMVGRMGVAGSVNIVFEADLTRYVAHRPSTLYWVLQTGADVGGIGMGLVRCVRPWHEWLVVWGYDIDREPPNLTEDYARRIAHHLIGDDSIPVTIKSSSAWTVNHLYAEKYHNGRVFCAGDAVHRHPPSNGLGLLSTEDPEQMQLNMAARKLPGAEAEKQRQLLREAIDFKNYEFNTYGVELDQRYQSGAVVPDGTPVPVNPRDHELYHHPTTWPGAKLPHAWLSRGTAQVSTLDIGGRGRFALLTGIGGEPWVHAAGVVSAALDVEIVAVSIGPGGDYEDLYGDWAALREVENTGCVLLRPDNYVGFRSSGVQPDPEHALAVALGYILAVGTRMTSGDDDGQ